MECKQLDFNDPATYDNAFRGMKSMFLRRPAKVSQVSDMKRLLLAAKQAGVKKIVYLSLLGSEKMPFLPDRKIEKLIMNMGFEFTFLRSSFFMQNLLTQHLEDIRDHHQIYVPAGNGKLSFIDARDVAEIAFLSLIHTGFQNNSFKLTGSQSLTYYEVAKILSEELDFNVNYINPTKHEFLKRCKQRGLSDAHTSLLANTYTAAKNGFFKRMRLDSRRILQRDPRCLWEFVRGYKSIFSY
ncbi:NmrA family NAD(P)-binding protein [Halobacillus shinanisalinarum]|uniref:NmrA family NAD(P)-binding protein n=1 Tax=Halobacillus shinanisalinarum TaxID=2932258 RepID=A0ABY4GUQ1_9BACI|nr:NmrA family NAD(P)-binding protein [Halobacillus shinanisalinarum]UOQ91759.1 NmrA family NAD(P)-binding protein [Halobacillus shinanisalinarum]